MTDEAFGPDYPRKRRYSTDPQDDVPCQGCETEGPEHALNDEGLCRACAAEDEDEDCDLAGDRAALLARVGPDALAEVER